MTLRELMKIVSSAYPDGLVMDYFDDPSGQHGDGLAQFIAAEVSELYYPHDDSEEQLAVAERALMRAVRQLQHVVDALEVARGEEEGK